MRTRSSVGQSGGLIIPWSWVQVPPGPPHLTNWETVGYLASNIFSIKARFSQPSSNLPAGCVFRSCWQARSATHQSQFLRLPKSDLSCGQPEIRMWQNGFCPWPNRFPYVASHECWRQYYVEMTPIHTTIDAKTNMK